MTFLQRADLARLFARAGIDIHEFIMLITEAEHKAIHSGARGGAWNAAWEAFFKEVPNATRAEIFAQVKKMTEIFQLTGPIIPR